MWLLAEFDDPTLEQCGVLELLKTWDFRQPEWHRVATHRTMWTSSNGLSHYRNILGCSTVFTLPPFFFSVEPVASKFQTQVLIAWADGTAWLRWIPNSLQNSHWATTELSQVLWNAFTAKACCAPVHGSIATTTLESWQQNGDSGICPSVAKPEKTVLQNRPIHLCTLYFLYLSYKWQNIVLNVCRSSCKVLYFCVTNQKWNEIFVKILNTKFHKHKYVESRAVPCRKT